MKWLGSLEGQPLVEVAKHMESDPLTPADIVALSQLSEADIRSMGSRLADQNKHRGRQGAHSFVGRGIPSNPLQEPLPEPSLDQPQGNQ